MQVLYTQSIYMQSKNLISIAHFICITAWLHTCAQFFYIELNLVPKAMQMCIAEQYLSTCPGTFYFCLNSVGTTMHIKCIRNSNSACSYLIFMVYQRCQYDTAPVISSTHHSWETMRLPLSCHILLSIGTQLPTQLLCRIIYKVSTNLKSTII